MTEAANDLDDVKTYNDILTDPDSSDRARVDALLGLIAIANKEAGKKNDLVKDPKIVVVHPRASLSPATQYKWYRDNYKEKVTEMLDRYDLRSSNPVFKAKAVAP